ncbi:triple tyrosine motif-containing protein [Clostridium sp. MB40-C1]|uniref:triple tyrosine motif-containing protein n=1 Tax=Clostridium sp. MB40-C1 TaxID=3070996 RepID=UPI0027DEDC47|nr:triple tyrosine motif-containing protein [Clostridium sp. MB40-C1]WMJ79587.1 triple tyrosine motif-containing protein [Clostridium sp. MB40-C1]
MNEILIGYNKESPQKKGSEIKINILSKPKDNLLFKYIVGLEGAWETLQDFSRVEEIVWKPEKDGRYILMVQAKEENSEKSFDYVSKYEYIIGEEYSDSTIIKGLFLSKKQFNIGEKLYLKVETNKNSVLYRYFIKKDEKWVLAKDYCTENTFVYSVKEIGEQEILVQCKSIDSEKKFDDAKKIAYKVIDINKLKINNFKCLSSLLVTNEELVFEVEAEYQDNRMILYKFIKINLTGQSDCIQDYSTKKVVSYKETTPGRYKILCLAKDIYSPNDYDDRAIIYYDVDPYEKIQILSFTSDISSPQTISKDIVLKAVAKGGKDLRYRYIIEGSKNEDSGYIKSNEYLWKPEEAGEYQIKLYVRDVSCNDKYEAYKIMNFTIDNLFRDPVKIDEIILDKKENLLVNESVNIKVIAEGGIELLYSFIVKKDSEEKEKVEYNECNWVKFVPEEAGKFEVEIRVKDKYSDKLFDAHDIIHINSYKYIPAKIDYILTDPKEYYLIGEQLVLDVITQDTCDILLKYVLQINGHEVEETDYVKSRRYKITPRCSGRYLIKVYGKNRESDKVFDCEKELEVIVNDAPPITNTRLKCDRFEFLPNEPIQVCAECDGGKDVIYEFYLMENKEWNLVQKYSKKNYYDFIPFKKGIYKILVLSKSSYKKISYEDYCVIKVKVTETPVLRNILNGDNKITNKEILKNTLLLDFTLMDS